MDTGLYVFGKDEVAASDPLTYLCPLYFCTHYENMPIQIYWKVYHPKMKKTSDKNLIFFISLLKT